MTIFLLYLLKVSVCTSVFYLAYNVALSKETFFKMNRIVLLLAVLASVVLPIWTLTISKEIIISQDLRQDIFVGGFSGDQLSASIDNAIDWRDFMPVIALIVFLTGATFISIKNLYGVFQISRIIKYSIKETQSDVNIHISKNDVIPFSWFRNIIISEEDYNSNREIIIEHERAHIQLNHNYDLLFINTVAIFQWFNPLFWLLRKELITIHEYQADNHVLQNGIDARKYQYLLISKGTMQSFSIPVVNHLCSGNFQKRVKMMLKKRSNPNKAIKVLLLIPLLAIAIAAFAKTEYVTSSPDVSLPNESVTSLPDVSVKSEIVKEPQRDTKVYRDQIVPVTIMKNGTYSLGQWSSYTSNKNINEASQNNIDQVIKDIVSKMKYPKDSIHFFIKFEEGDLQTVNSDQLKSLQDALKSNGIKSISAERKTNDAGLIMEFPKSLESEIVRFVAINIKYPADAKNSGTNGVFFVRIKAEKGEVKLAEIIDNKENINVPLLDKILVVAYGKDAKDTTDTKLAKNDSSIKTELFRVAGLISQIENPEWKNTNFDFALELMFELR